MSFGASFTFERLLWFLCCREIMTLNALMLKSANKFVFKGKIASLIFSVV